MTIKCANCYTSVDVSEDQSGKLLKCPTCKSILLAPRRKGAMTEGDAPTVEAKSFDEFKQEILEAIRAEAGDQDGSADKDELAAQIRDSLKPELEQWVATHSTAAAAGIDAEALRSQLQADILKEVRADIEATRGSAGTDAASAAAFAKAIEALGEKLVVGGPAAPATATVPTGGSDKETEAKRKRLPRKPFAPPSRDVELPDTPQEAYPEVEPQEPDVERVIDLNAGDNENLRAFLNEAASVEGRLVMFEPTQSLKDVGNWRRARVWMAVTEDTIYLAAYGRRPFHQEVDLGGISESFWNEFTSEVVFVPYSPEEDDLGSVKLTEDRGYYLLGLIHHGVPAS